MLNLTIGGKEYHIEYSYNSFCDTDLMDRVSDLLALFNGSTVADDKDVMGMGKMKELFKAVRDLLYVGLSDQGIDSPQEAGKLLDIYRREAPEGEKRGVLQIFSTLSAELTNEGFFYDLMEDLNQMTEEAQTSPVVLSDHQKKSKKK